VGRLRGMFAFALWDASERRLHLVRDRLGIKPLYYGTTADGDLVFGSELKALMAHPRVSRELEPQALEAYLALGYVPDPMAIFKGVHKLSPGHRLCYNAADTRLSLAEYWDVAFVPGDEGIDAATSELRERLEESVRMRLVSDVPLGAFLSGGVDSSAIVALMAGLTDSPVNTCAIGFDRAGFDEAVHARRVAEHLHTRHREREVAANDYGLVDTLVTAYDEPFADASALPTYRVCELARQQVKVALSGDGGDEDFAGYRRYRLYHAESRARARVPGLIRRPLFGALAQAYPKMDWAPRPLRAKTTFQSLAMNAAEGYCHGVSVIPESLREALYSPAFKRELAGYRVRELFAGHAARATDRHPLSLAQYLDYKTYLPGDILTKVDRASMAHSLEVRVPFLDHEFVSWAARLDPAHKLHRGEGKYILKRAFEGRLPHDILYRRKMGFSVPLADWFRGPLREAARRATTEGALVASGFFRRESLKQLYTQHVSGRRDHSAALWSLLMLSRFIETTVAGATRAPVREAVAQYG
jgi:asparagine synthase (glutamine-hydrolysing)